MNDENANRFASPPEVPASSSAEPPTESRQDPPARPVELYGPRGEIVHLRKFMDGRMTPMEAHILYAWGNRPCSGCGGHPAVRIKVFLLLSEAVERAPEFIGAIAARNEGNVPSAVMSDGRRYLLASENTFCRDCKAVAIREAARGVSSTCIVEVDEGPDEKRGPFEMVPRNYRERKV